MLNIYLSKPDRVINLNDGYFSKFTFDLLEYELSKKIVMNIDGVELTNDFMIVSKFTDGKVDLSKLSTGCKTALNVVSNPDKVFDIFECGLNAITEIYKTGIGNIYTKELILPFGMDFDCDINLIYKDNQKKFNKISDLINWHIDGGFDNEDKACDN